MVYSDLLKLLQITALSPEPQAHNVEWYRSVSCLSSLHRPVCRLSSRISSVAPPLTSSNSAEMSTAYYPAWGCFSNVAASCCSTTNMHDFITPETLGPLFPLLPSWSLWARLILLLGQASHGGHRWTKVRHTDAKNAVWKSAGGGGKGRIETRIWNNLKEQECKK